MKQFLQANNQDGVTFDGMKAWRAKFADAEQKYIASRGKGSDYILNAAGCDIARRKGRKVRCGRD